MSQSKKVMSQPLDRWEMLKSNAFEVESILLHQSKPVFTTTCDTIHPGKPALNGIKMWRAPSGYLLEMPGKGRDVNKVMREFIELTAVHKCIPK